LSSAIPDVSYPALRRRLAKLRAIDLIGEVDSASRSTFMVGDWLRRAVVPLAMAVRWERDHEAGSASATEADVEAVFLLVLPLVESHGSRSGRCALAVLVGADRATLVVELERGRLSARAAGADNPSTWVLGTLDIWLQAVIDGDSTALRIGGAKPRLVKDLVAGLHSIFASLNAGPLPSAR